MQLAKPVCVASFVVLGLAATALAQNKAPEAESYDGFALKQDLESCHTHIGGGCSFALGYVRGIVAFDQTTGGGSDASWKSCIPDGIRNGEFEDVVLKYIADHPTSQHEPAWAVVFDAMPSAYPCPVKTKK